jgi:sigma-54 specific flagellar transcriptional regulator A
MYIRKKKQQNFRCFLPKVDLNQWTDNLSLANSIIGNSREASELRALIKTVGPSDATVLITGDSGTGKELVAQALHDCSSRSSGAFIPVNCGAIPKDLLESELFGHKKGAFTGALSDRKGRFQLANNGTLFLDEIGDMSMDLQVKLLRVLQERIIDPVGSQESLAIDVRVVAATHKNIEALIQQGKFREDLYYRLNVMPLDIARLSERKGDIPALVSHFAKEHCDSNGQAIRLNQFSMQLFNNYSWPGNVRELSNLMARYSALFPGSEVDLRRIPASLIPMGIRSELDDGSSQALQAMSQESHAELAMAELVDIDTNGDEESNDPEDEVKRVISLAQGGEDFPDQGVKLKQHLLNIEKTIIQQALEKANGNVSQAARLLSLQRTTLIEKINKYGLGNSA